MRIVDTYLPNIASAQTEKSAKSTAAGESSASTALSQPQSAYGDSADVSRLSILLNEAMNTDLGTVEVLRAQYQSGEYQVDTAALGKVLAREFMNSGW